MTTLEEVFIDTVWMSAGMVSPTSSAINVNLEAKIIDRYF